LATKERTSNREFLLYWAGVFVIALAIVSVMLMTSGLVTDILSTQCYFPYISPMLGVPEPSVATTTVIRNATDSGGGVITSPEMPHPYPYYCYGNPVVAVIQFTFKLLSSLIFIGVGAYMIQNGKRH